MRVLTSLMVPLLVLAACSDEGETPEVEDETDGLFEPFDVESCTHTRTWDYDEDGSTDWLQVFTVLPSLDAGISYKYDVDNDGRWDAIYEATVLADGRLATQADDDDGNGLPNMTWLYTYEPNATYLEVRDATGNLTATQYWVTNDQGEATRSEIDNDGDGDIDITYEVEYDDEDRLVRKEYDLDNDAEIDEVYICAYTGDEFACEEYDADGERTAVEEHQYVSADDLWVHTYDDGSDGDLDYERYYRLDGEERLVADKLDEDGDGLFELDVTAVWDGDDLIEQHGFHGIGGNRDWVDDYFTYDERGFEVGQVREFRNLEDSRVRDTYVSETDVACEEVTHTPYP